MQYPLDLLQNCWFLAGPTASGKSELALELACRLNAEIVALDSMSLYRDMNIGTAKSSREMQAAVPHHLIDIIDPHEEFSLAQFVTTAATACGDIRSRGKTPLFVGGTGLYLRGILRGVFEGPPADWDYRRRLELEATREDPGFLHRQLQDVDAPTATRLHPNDARRIIRALEVRHLTGQPLSSQQREGPLPPEVRPPHVFWISPPRDWLHARINARVDWMMRAGLVEEVQMLLQRALPLSRTARQALGYKEVIDCLESNGDFEECADLIQRRTRQFAKRQCTWFRNLEECAAVEIKGSESVAALSEHIMGLDARTR